MAKMILIGLVEPPSPEAGEQFRERYLGNHIEDIANCPGFLSGTVYELEHAHDEFPVISRFLTVYELEAPITSRDVHRRAKVYLDAVNREIETLIRKTWPSHQERLRLEGLV